MKKAIFTKIASFRIWTDFVVFIHHSIRLIELKKNVLIIFIKMNGSKVRGPQTLKKGIFWGHISFYIFF